MPIKVKQAIVHIALLAITLVTTTLAGVEWIYGKSVFTSSFTWDDFLLGLPYSIPFLGILTVHEFGHYFTAIYHRVKTSLPYYIPLPPISLMLGTLGALIRLRGPVISKKQHFDIGIAGPLAGFAVALGVLWYGFSHLPPPEYIFQFHPEYKIYGADYADHVYSAAYLAQQGGADVVFGKNLIYVFFEKWVAAPERIPNVHEIMHYPYLFAGFLALVFTSINLLPIGQLDGGHILYGLLGHEGHRKVATVVFFIFLFYAGLGYINFNVPFDELLWKASLYIGFLYLCISGLRRGWKDTLLYAVVVFTAQYVTVFFFPALQGYSGWLLFIFILGRFIGISHPSSAEEQPLSRGRQWLGWIALLVFVLCFTPRPIEVVSYTSIVP